MCRIDVPYNTCKILIWHYELSSKPFIHYQSTHSSRQRYHHFQYIAHDTLRLQTHKMQFRVTKLLNFLKYSARIVNHVWRYQASGKHLPNVTQTCNILWSTVPISHPFSYQFPANILGVRARASLESFTVQCLPKGKWWKRVGDLCIQKTGKVLSY